ncbi:hypothetical protein MMC26_003416 [Xylographa opegraphella]|nr:hypothetical protein [Xylographa opegraphella]
MSIQDGSIDGSPVNVSTPSQCSSSPILDTNGAGKNGLEPIAIVGMGCRLPGDINSPLELWKAIMAKRIANSVRVPSSRFNIDGHYHERLDRPGSFNVPGGYFLEGSCQEFDPVLFGISPIEALLMDPQQRKLLEVVYEAFESGGFPMEKMSGTATGCFVGCFTSDFQQMSFKEPDFRHAYSATGVDPGIISNRISHVFNLRGPSIMVNTACSSSLYALHNACNAIRNRECDGAIVGGTNLLLTVDQHMNTAKLGVLSPTSTCHTYDESADGYGRAEGIGALYIKRLDDALRDGDNVRAIIRSSAVNSNPRVAGVGFTSPSAQGQADAIVAAYKRADLDANFTSYVECHGTGTPVGDPIEVRAISMAMSSPMRSGEPILIGSVKPNIGHSEASSSISTMIKAILAVEKGIIPPTAGISVLNKKIQWDELQVKVVTEPSFFPPSLPFRRVGISASGYGGTNGHVIIDNAHSTLPRQHSIRDEAGSKTTSNRPHILVFSAHDKPTLMRNLDAYSNIEDTVNLPDLAYTLASRRSKLSFRTFGICRTQSLQVDILKASHTVIKTKDPASVAFVFTGQGAQWARMGAELFELYPSFVQTIEELDRVLAWLPDPPTWTIRDSLLEASASSRIGEPELSQPLCTALQLALVDILGRWNIFPVVTVGHSSGEIAAAYAAGYISAEDAITAAYYRGKVMSSLTGNGAMLAVGVGAILASKYLDKYYDRVVVACHNSPDSVTLSGDADAIEELRLTFQEVHIFARVLHTGGKAYHSHHMAKAANIYERYLRAAGIRTTHKYHRAHRCDMISSVTGSSMGQNIPDSSYWIRNLVSPVLFNQAIQTMAGLYPNGRVLVEIGPHNALSAPIRQICSEYNYTALSYVPTLLRKQHDGEQMLRLAGDLWSRDTSIDITLVTQVETLQEDGRIGHIEGNLVLDLPTYQWTYSKEYWQESRHTQEHRQHKHPRHDILGRRLPGLNPSQPVWRNLLRHKDVPWLRHHTIGGEALFPGAGYIAMAIEALTQMNSDSADPLQISAYTLKNISIKTALVIPDNDEGVEVLFSLRPVGNESMNAGEALSNTSYGFVISSHYHGVWNEHAAGTVGIYTRKRPEPAAPPILPLCTSARSWTQRFQEVGFDYGGTFQDMINVRSDGKTYAATADSVVKQECGIIEDESRYALHPGCIDSLVHLIIPAIYAGKLNDVTCGMVSTGFAEVTIWNPTSNQLSNPHAKSYAWTPKHGARTFLANAQLVGSDGQLVADFVGVRCASYEAAVPLSTSKIIKPQPYTRMEWKADIDHLESPKEVSIFSRPDVGSLVSLLVHKNAALRILDIGGKQTPAIVANQKSINLTATADSENAMLNLKQSLPELESLKFAQFVTDALVREGNIFDSPFDLVISTGLLPGQIVALRNIRRLLAPGGRLLLAESVGTESAWAPVLPLAGFTGIDCYFHDIQNSCSTMLSRVQPNSAISSSIPPSRQTVLLVYRNAPHLLVPLLIKQCNARGWSVRSQALKNVKHQRDEHVIMLAELEGPVLATLQEDEMRSIQKLTEQASSIVWVTAGGLYSGREPEYAMTAGFARALTSEKLSLKLVTIDVDQDNTSNDQLSKTVIDITVQQLTENNVGETEYLVDHGIVHICRLVANEAINNKYTIDSTHTELVELKKAPALKGALQSGKLVFEHDDCIRDVLKSGQVELRVEAIGINNEDHLAMAESGYSNILSHEVAGIITRTGPEVSEFKIGDRVVGLSFDTLSTVQQTRAALLQPIADGDSFEMMVTLPMAFATAIYGLNELARIGSEDVVLITDATGPAGLAAIQMCRVTKSKALIVANCEETRKWLKDSGFPPECVLSEGDELSTHIKHLTEGQGVDVIFGSASARPEDLRECYKGLATFARVIIFAENDGSKYDLRCALPQIAGLSLFTFDISDLYREKPDILSRLLKRCFQLYRNGDIHTLPMMVGEISNSEKLISSFSNRLGTDKLVISYEPSSLVKVSTSTAHGPFLRKLTNHNEQVLPPRPSLRFRSDATYLLVGCLGGLGRSLTSWMVERGAKHIAFMSRSGAESPSAATLVAGLKQLGVEVTILRSDVTSKKDVETAIERIDGRYPICGVLNAAMVLEDGIFQNMSIDSWRKAVNPKLHGSLNLHEAFKDHSLDFFVMTSSISGTLGTPGQSNYAAANAFMDSLARHRRVQGLPAVSLILPMILGVGWIAEHPELEDDLRRRGIYGANEEEMLASFEIAMTPPTNLKTALDHLIVGLEPSQLAIAASQADSADVFWLEDPRFQAVKVAMAAQAGDTVGSSASGKNIIADINTAKSIDEAVAAVAQHTVEKLSRLLLIDAAEIQVDDRSVASYGLDSMIGADFRNWIFREFKVDMPFQQLLGQDLTIMKFAAVICGKVRVEA